MTDHQHLRQSLETQLNISDIDLDCEIEQNPHVFLEALGCLSRTGDIRLACDTYYAGIAWYSRDAQGEPDEASLLGT